MGLSSLVATTATDFERLLPSVSSMNSRTSRPRSPTSAITTLSKASARASMESSVDLPTPEPAKMPRRCPRQSGEKMSIARTPVLNPCSTRLRVMEGGATFAIERRTSPCSSTPRPSIGSASALMVRPHHLSVGAMRKAPLRMTISWMPIGSPGSIGQTTTRSGSTRTTSPRWVPVALLCATKSPSRTCRDRPLTV